MFSTLESLVIVSHESISATRPSTKRKLARLRCEVRKATFFSSQAELLNNGWRLPAFTKMAMMTTTTSSSIRVNARECYGGDILSFSMPAGFQIRFMAYFFHRMAWSALK